MPNLNSELYSQLAGCYVINSEGRYDPRLLAVRYLGHSSIEAEITNRAKVLFGADVDGAQKMAQQLFDRSVQHYEFWRGISSAMLGWAVNASIIFTVSVAWFIRNQPESSHMMSTILLMIALAFLGTLTAYSKSFLDLYCPCRNNYKVI